MCVQHDVLAFNLAVTPRKKLSLPVWFCLRSGKPIWNLQRQAKWMQAFAMAKTK